MQTLTKRHCTRNCILFALCLTLTTIILDSFSFSPGFIPLSAALNGRTPYHSL
jgi:hypothetical protein